MAKDTIFTKANFDGKAPMVDVGKHPINFSIHGIEDRVVDLKEFVKASDEIEDGLKTYMLGRLDKITTNAAEIHMHEVEQPGETGSVDLHLSIRAKHHGMRAGMVKRRNEVVPVRAPIAHEPDTAD